MRMWMVEPIYMCRKHLLGEHVELHMLVGAISKGRSIKGFIDKGLVDVSMIVPRHEALVEEMKHRGYDHNSPLIGHGVFATEYDRWLEYSAYKINSTTTHAELNARCKECKTRWMKP